METVPPLSVSAPNLLPVAPTIASHGPAGLGVLGVETVDTRTLQEKSVLFRCERQQERCEREVCVRSRRSPSDALERVRQVEVLGLATDGSERCERHNSDAKCVDMLMHANDKIVHQANIVLNAAILYICGMA